MNLFKHIATSLYQPKLTKNLGINDQQNKLNLQDQKSVRKMYEANRFYHSAVSNINQSIHQEELFGADNFNKIIWNLEKLVNNMNYNQKENYIKNNNLINYSKENFHIDDFNNYLDFHSINQTNNYKIQFERHMYDFDLLNYFAIKSNDEYDENGSFIELEISQPKVKSWLHRNSNCFHLKPVLENDSQKSTCTLNRKRRKLSIKFDDCSSGKKINNQLSPNTLSRKSKELNLMQPDSIKLHMQSYKNHLMYSEAEKVEMKKNSLKHTSPKTSSISLLASSQELNKTNEKQRKDNEILENIYKKLENEINEMKKTLPNSNMFSISKTNYDSPEMKRLIEKAKYYREDANRSSANLIWNGVLPTKSFENAEYSRKVFIGGLPYDITTAEIEKAFAQYGKVKILFPGLDVKCSPNSIPSKAGYGFGIFHSSAQVEKLLNACQFEYDERTGECKWYCHLSSSNKKNKKVEIRPWSHNDSHYVIRPIDSNIEYKELFIGAVHGMITAQGLAVVIDKLFGGVIKVTMDIDKVTKYPIGSAHVLMESKSYQKAIDAHVIKIITPTFSKKLQLDPFIESANCSNCKVDSGPVFCRDPSCMKYYCDKCFNLTHATFSKSNHHIIIK